MGFSNRDKKRLLIFLFVPIISAIPFLITDFIVQVLCSIITVIYVGFIIFLRDSVRGEIPSFSNDYLEEPAENDIQPISTENNKSKYMPDAGEDFKIISKNKSIDVITADNFVQSHGGEKKKTFFIPPDLKENFDKIATEEIPEDVSHDEQFGFVLEKILSVAKEAFLAHTAIFFWYNPKKKRLTLEKFISASRDISRRKYDLENDILSRIVSKQEPELINDIMPNAEEDIIRYYDSKQGIKSFVGVPLFFGKSLTGILALDSKVIDAFGIETIYSLGRFVRVISIIITMFDEKHEESLSRQRLKSLLSIVGSDKKFTSESEVLNSLESTAKNLIHWDVFSFVCYDPMKQKFFTNKIVNNTSIEYINENIEIDFNNTLVGRAIMSAMPVRIDDSSLSTFVRFSNSEKISFDGSFLAIPLIYDDQNYGVLCFESLQKNAYTNSDVRFLKNAFSIFSFIIYSHSTHSILKSLLSVDIETRVYNKNSFIEIVNKDLKKGLEYNVQGALALLKIDDFISEETLFDSDPFPLVLQAIMNKIKSNLLPHSIIGRLDNKIIAIYYFNSNVKDVYVWAEDLRVKIAREPIEASIKQTMYTISGGVAGTNNKTNIDEVIERAKLALNKALEKGGNCIKDIA